VFVVAAHEFGALDRGYHANGALIARFGPLNAPQATYADRTGQRNFIR
jgi:hypothetical protein